MKKTTPAFLKRFFEAGYSEPSPWPARIFLCLAVLISYAGVWSNEFVFDDRNLIINNSFLRHWGSLFRLLTSTSTAGLGVAHDGFYRPVPMLIYFFIYQAFGLSTIVFHALNVALQALNACLLHRFGIRAGFSKGAVFAAALLWAVHPLHTSDVSYISATPELLWSAFCLLGLITLLPDFTPHKIGKSLIFFVLALGCKESAVVFPALAVATLFFVNKDRLRLSTYLKTWPLWLISALYISAWILFMHETGYSMDKTGNAEFFQGYTSNLTNRILTCLATLPVYAQLIIWPEGLHVERDFPFFSTLLPYPAAGALMAVLGFLQVLRVLLRRNKHTSEAGRRLALSFGIFWFAAAFSPYTSIVFPIDERIAEGWMYMPTMGLFLGVAQTCAGFFEKRKNAVRLLVLALAFSLGVTTFFQNETWRNSETLYQNTLQNGGYIYRLSYHAGLFNLEHHDFDEAAGQFQDLIDHSDGRSALWSANVHMLLAAAWLQPDLDANDVITVDAVMRALPSSTHISEAIAEYGRALQDSPDLYWAHKYLAVIYRYQGNNQMADFHQKRVDAILKIQGGP